MPFLLGLLTTLGLYVLFAWVSCVGAQGLKNGTKNFLLPPKVGCRDNIDQV